MQIAYTCGSYVCVEASECATSKPSQWQALEASTAQAGGVLLSLDWSSLHGYIVTGGEDCRCASIPSACLAYCFLPLQRQHLEQQHGLRALPGPTAAL